MISVVIPAFNEQENIPAAAERLGSILAPLSDYELIFVDDGSKDGTWELIKQLGETDEHIRGLHFSRNFGKEGAVFAGLKAADGFSTVILLLLIIGSILMLGIGIMGYYLSKIYEEIKQRPRYIVSEESGRRQRCEDNK